MTESTTPKSPETTSPPRAKRQRLSGLTMEGRQKLIDSTRVLISKLPPGHPRQPALKHHLHNLEALHKWKQAQAMNQEGKPVSGPEPTVGKSVERPGDQK